MKCSNLNDDLENLEIEEDDTAFNNNDADICSENELDNKFSTQYHLALEQALSLGKTYILDLDASNNTELRVAVALSDKSCSIQQITESSLRPILDFNQAHTKTITNIRFDNYDDNLVYSSSLDGTIKLWDRRQTFEVATLKDDTLGPNHLKPITSFDVSQNGRLLCAGTELYGSEVFLLFWDLRSKDLLGGYWETHTDDITHVKFHKTNSNLIATGSTDGLINVFNLKEETEDDALLYTYNTDSSVHKFDWFSYTNGEGVTTDAIAFITHTEGLEMWKLEDSDAFCKFSRENISAALQRKSVEDSYIANIHETEHGSGELIIVAGSNVQTGKCLRTLSIDANNDKPELKPKAQLSGNKQIVRTSWYSPKDKIFVTGGECGILNVWRPGAGEWSPKTPNGLKTVSAVKNAVKVKSKPY